MSLNCHVADGLGHVSRRKFKPRGQSGRCSCFLDLCGRVASLVLRCECMLHWLTKLRCAVVVACVGIDDDDEDEEEAVLLVDYWDDG